MSPDACGASRGGCVKTPPPAAVRGVLTCPVSLCTAPVPPTNTNTHLSCLPPLSCVLCCLQPEPPEGQAQGNAVSAVPVSCNPEGGEGKLPQKQPLG